ncbi:AAA family ATPase [Nitratidesulfovibrio sp. HK-II]|uniref:AAA family ATPase n=1 Tax=Nitratidesulfovibrio sp. HK-II TaxID=2009266 RepID=UPI000ECF5A67|nr:AAA family ATPase [Nitratidesulfovibrio sp. HK-II]GBO97020.1 hypothetical protein RVX_2059 [Nitratidesulfovibrio sp. HK-II]
MILNEIIAWAKSKLPDWQFNVVVNLASNQSVDIDFVFDECLRHVVLGGDAKCECDLSACCAESVMANRVSLLEIKDIKNVNALAAISRIKFLESGVSVVYGDNGSGKSSYSRIFKSACRCVGPKERVLGDVFSENCGGESSAAIVYRCGDDVKNFKWSDGSSNVDLAAIGVFDSKSASVYVTKENKIAFTPFGIDILPRLAEICDEVSCKINDKMKQYRIDRIKFPDSCAKSDVAEWYGKISGSTSSDDLTLNTEFCGEDDEKIDRLTRALNDSDPERAIKRLRGVAERVMLMKNSFEEAYLHISQEGVDSIFSAYSEYCSSKKARDALSMFFLDGRFIPNTGGDEWRALWVAARNFFDSAYGDGAFPLGGDTRVCALCQQDLSSVAVNRFEQFEAYVASDVEKSFLYYEKVYKDKILNLEKLAKYSIAMYPVLLELDDEYSRVFSSFIDEVAGVANSVMDALNRGEVISVAGIHDFKNFYFEKLKRDIEQEISEYVGISDGEVRRQVIAERANLEARKILSVNKDHVFEIVQKLNMKAALEAALESAKTHAITRAANSFTEKYITTPATKSFDRYVGILLGERKKVVLEKAKTNKGVVYFRVKLKDMRLPASVEDIVSEGEFRAIALACFLAEIDQSREKHAVIFDDPVSSLDHKIRKSFAEIIATLGSDRQVVVLTHDIYFLAQVLAMAKTKAVGVSEFQTKQLGNKFGYIVDGVPVSAMPLDDRLNSIELKAKAAIAAYSSGNAVEAEALSSSAGVFMRRACEHIVEKVLLGGIVLRFDEAIHTGVQHFEEFGLLKINRGDISMIVEMMTEYSKYLHDSAPASDVVTPDPHAILNDVVKIRDWRREFKKRAVPSVADSS